MPIIHFHLAEGRYSEAQQRRLLVESSQLYAQVLRCPMDRVRAYLQFYPQQLIAVAGERAVLPLPGARRPLARRAPRAADRFH